MTYETECSGSPEVAQNNTTLLGTQWTAQKGKASAQKIASSTFRCLDVVQFYMIRYANVSFHIEVRKDSGGKPQGTPLVNDSGRIANFIFSYTDIPTSWGWVNGTLGVIVPTGSNVWICFVPSDFVDSPVYRDSAYDRFALRDGNNLTSYPSSIYMAGEWTNSSSFAFAIYKKPTYTTPCPTPAVALTIPA